MDTTSLWREISPKQTLYTRLEKDISVDVAIIGGGITGLTVALQLLQTNQTVAIIEKDTIGSGTTGDSTGNLYIPVQPYYQSIASKFSVDTAKIIADSRGLAMDYIEHQVRTLNLDCHFKRRPWYAFASEKQSVEKLEKEVELFKKMQIPLEFTQSLPFDLKFNKAATLPHQARINPLQYVIGLAKHVAKKECQIFENTPVQRIEDKKIPQLITANGKVSAKKIVIATHTPIGIHSVQLYTAPYRSYVVAVHLKSDEYPEAHLWDMDGPKYAVCTHPIVEANPELLMVAGSHHKTGQGEATKQHYAELTTYLKQHYDVANVAAEWSAQHYQAADDVPYIGPIGRFSKHIYLATGFFADGLVYGTLAGMILGDVLLGTDNKLQKTYLSTRFDPLKSASSLLSENLNVLLQYYKDIPFLRTDDFNAITKGEGKVIEVDREKWAVARDDKNQLHVVSAVCTHMKCIVNWNNAEKTWDCPCHGSRFNVEGKVLEGPAMHPLKKHEKMQNN